ncbi:DUF917 domain-containing protein [Enemella evansiae]|uniref:DUF917 domain-containing protein n=1 Tax=Enemella evansiae TaxID=2016499 RepID=UPI0010D34757|nr:DUF917 domain-containing protein [Enemella evansiae]TDO91666.1 hypothetical protein C8D81_1977 [Enemella evansiae]
MRRIDLADLETLALGCALLGSAGGGTTTHLELMAGQADWPVTLLEVDDLDPATRCLAPAFAGSTMILGERLPGAAPFARVVAAVEQWVGAPVPAVCALEVGGLNGLTPVVAAQGRAIVDADCMGRAMPGFDQVTLLVDRLPGLVIATGIGDGVAIVASERPEDAERITRAALEQAGGTGVVVLGGFTVGALRDHAVTGSISTALELGRVFRDALTEPLETLAGRLGGRLLAAGRILASQPDTAGGRVQSFEIEGTSGAVHRLITRSEAIAFVTDGELRSAAPDIIVVLDARSRAILEVPSLAVGQHVAVLELPGPPWWRTSTERLRHVVPSTYGLAELDPAG